jgi:4-hydroxyphenylacetate 3-monooxygenase/4-hydroxybutyryl-CoA dehydratase/vinylacetyl-CoA-Delta-isomerase
MEETTTLRTSEQYREALKRMKPAIIKNKLLEKPYDDEDIQKGVNVVGLSYDRARDEKYRDMMTVKSPYTGTIINRYNHIPMTKEDLAKKQQMIYTLAKEVFCAQRCVGSDALHTLFIGTYKVDQSNKFETDYHERFKKYLKYIQENDISPSGAITDGKGDRSLSPMEQHNTDSYVHIVKETDEGIYVSGVKTPITMSLYSEEIIVVPGLQYSQDNANCAVAFAVPTDTKGVELYVLGPEIRSLKGKMSPNHGKKYLNKEGMIVFDNVFVPKERVFLCGEYRFAATFANIFATLHRFAYTACKPAVYEHFTGAAMLISEYNGTKGEYFLSNNSEKVFEIYKTAITVKGLCKAAIGDAQTTESGALMPDPIFANMGKYLSSENFHSAISTLQDMAGNLPANLPYEELLEDEGFRNRMEKLLTRRKGVSIEDQYALNELIRIMVASNEGGLLQIGSKHGGGNKEAEKVAIYGNSLRAINECKNCIQRMSQDYK